MIIAVADTHVLIWYLSNDTRLSATANQVIKSAVVAGHEIGISSVTLAEMVYLVEKGRIPPEAFSLAVNVLADEDWVFVEIPFTHHIARAMTRIDARQIPDLPDRMIAATGLSLNVPLISRDGLIRAANLHTIW